MIPDFESDLTIQQQAFVEAYVVDFNQTKAAKTAGYSEKSASDLGHQLLKNPRVKAAIAERLKEIGTEHEVLKQRVLNELCKLAFTNMADYETHDEGGVRLKSSSELTRAQSAAIQEVKETRSEKSTNVSFKLFSKEKALEMLGRHLAMFTEKTEHSGKVQVGLSDTGLWDLKNANEG